MATLNLEKFYAAGGTAKQAVDQLAPRFPNLNVTEARKAGIPDEDIAHFMATGHEFDRTPGSPAVAAAGTVGRGINTSLATAIGGVGDLVSGAHEALPMISPMAGVINSQLPEDPQMQRAYLPTGGDVRQAFNLGGNLMQSAVGAENSNITYEGLESLPRTQRPFAVGGEAMGNSLPFSLAPMAAARAGYTGVNSLAQPLMDMVRNAPGKYALGELTAAAGAAHGGGLAQALAPGSDTARFIGEATGSLAHPLALGTKYGVKGITSLVGSFLPGGRERRAAEWIANAYAKSGEDPEGVLQALAAAQALDLPAGAARGTVAQQTGSKTAIRIQNYLAANDPDYKAQMGDDAANAMGELTKASDALVASGDPQSLAAAAQTRADRFNLFAKTIFTNAQEQAQAAIRAIGRGGDPRKASKEAQAVLRTALDTVNQEVADVWARVGKDTPVVGSHLKTAISKARESLLATGQFPESLEKEFAAFFPQKAGEADLLVTAGRMLTLRGNLLEKARKATTKGNFGAARRYDSMADAILDDLGTIPGGAADEARAMTSKLHDTFTNTFANLGLQKAQMGGKTLKPNEMLYEAFGAGGVVNANQIAELRAAAALPTSGDTAAQMEGSLMEFVRGHAQKELTDPQTGRLRSEKAADMAVNQEAMETFGPVRSDIDAAWRAEQDLQLAEKRPRAASAAIGDDTPFGQLIRGKDPVNVTAQALKGGDSSYNRIANLALRSGRGAIAGLKSATLESVMHSAGFGTEAGGSFSKFRNLLTKAPTSQSKSPLDLMLHKGIITAPEAERLKMILDRGALIEKVGADKSLLSEVGVPPDALTDAIIGSAGAVGASNVASTIMGPVRNAGLIIASYGSKVAKQFVNRDPAARTMNSLMALTRDPEAFAAAIRRVPKRAEIHSQINGALAQAGADPLFADVEEQRRGLPTAARRTGMQ